jgi:Domain of unknown function (DUF4258)
LNVSETPIVLTEHARWQAQRRGLQESTILQVATAPEQVVQIGPHSEIRQSRFNDPTVGKPYLVRVVVATGTETLKVITVYRTSKINKYWRTT